ncbi:MAG: RNA polymerase sigma-70 factor [Chitinophagaceae bacterium]|nr:RNA polymerase sigma-70 factor [Chitinophagaceae bacterium]
MLAHTTHTEPELLEQLKAGDRLAFTTIYETFAPSLIGFAASKVSSLEEARDIIHDLFTHLWEQREKINITASLKSFLFTAVRYRVIDHIRKSATRKEYAGMLQQLNNRMIIDAESEMVSKNMYQALEHAVEDLPSRTKQIYRLSRYRHLAVKEIACELGLSEQTVKNQLSTALNHLRISWQKLSVVLLWFFS